MTKKKTASETAEKKGTRQELSHVHYVSLDEIQRLRREALLRAVLLLRYYGWTDWDEC